MVCCPSWWGLWDVLGYRRSSFVALSYTGSFLGNPTLLSQHTSRLANWFSILTWQCLPQHSDMNEPEASPGQERTASWLLGNGCCRSEEQEVGAMLAQHQRFGHSAHHPDTFCLSHPPHMVPCSAVDILHDLSPITQALVTPISGSGGNFLLQKCLIPRSSFLTLPLTGVTHQNPPRVHHPTALSVDIIPAFPRFLSALDYVLVLLVWL